MRTANPICPLNIQTLCHCETLHDNAAGGICENKTFKSQILYLLLFLERAKHLPISPQLWSVFLNGSTCMKLWALQESWAKKSFVCIKKTWINNLQAQNNLTLNNIFNILTLCLTLCLMDVGHNITKGLETSTDVYPDPSSSIQSPIQSEYIFSGHPANVSPYSISSELIFGLHTSPEASCIKDCADFIPKDGKLTKFESLYAQKSPHV